MGKDGKIAPGTWYVFKADYLFHRSCNNCVHVYVSTKRNKYSPVMQIHTSMKMEHWVIIFFRMSIKWRNYWWTSNTLNNLWWKDQERWKFSRYSFGKSCILLLYFHTRHVFLDKQVSCLVEAGLTWFSKIIYLLDMLRFLNTKSLKENAAKHEMSGEHAVAACKTTRVAFPFHVLISWRKATWLIIIIDAHSSLLWFSWRILEMRCFSNTQDTSIKKLIRKGKTSLTCRGHPSWLY